MLLNPRRWPSWLFVLILFLLLMAGGFVVVTVVSPPPREVLRPLEPPPTDLKSATPSPSQSPDALVGVVPPGRTDAFGSTPPGPMAVGWSEWVQTTQVAPVWPRPEPRFEAVDLWPAGAILKVLGASSGRVRVYYAGDTLGRFASEGWVDASDLASAKAPRWTVVRRPATVRSAPQLDASVAGSLPPQAVVEVIEEQGRFDHVFYLGNGQSQGTLEGWVDGADLGAAARLLAAEKRGVRIVSKSDAKAIESGGGVWLRVPFRTQLDGSASASANCGPASTAMALELFGFRVPTGQIRDMVEKLQGTDDPDSGIAIEHLKTAVESFGLKGLDMGAPKDLRRWTIEELRRHIIAGRPVIVELRYYKMPGRGESDYYGDHYVVINGIRGDDFIYNDSIDTDGPGFGRLMSAETLQKAWEGSDCPLAAFAVSGS